MKSILLVFASWRMMTMLLLGFSCGIPLALTGATLQAWMATEGVDLAVIGVFSLAGLPFALKFLWAPFMDRYTMPFLGRRRGWMLVTQVFLVLMISIIAYSDPKSSTSTVAALAVLMAFFSASQDIVVDAYRREVLKPEEFGASFGVYSAGYRLAMITSGALALILADHMPWRMVYLIMATTMSVGIIATVFAPEPEDVPARPRTIQEAVILPFLEFFKRKGAVETLVFLLLYKLDAQMTVALTTPFMLSLGFSKTDIGAVTKGFGIIAVLVGTLLGGGIIAKTGIRLALWIFGITQALAALSYMALAHAGHNYPFMVVAITIENFFAGTAMAAFSAFMMSICDKRFAATQYALLSSFMALSRYIAGAPSGFLVNALGWEHYYLLCAVVGIPGLLLLTRYPKWKLPEA